MTGAEKTKNETEQGQRRRQVTNPEVVGKVRGSRPRNFHRRWSLLCLANHVATTPPRRRAPYLNSACPSISLQEEQQH
jgi:hypothetical protein